MIILFKKRDGECVETTDKNVLVKAAAVGEIGPDTIVTVDGMGVEARRIKGLVFGEPTPNPTPKPDSKPAVPAKADPSESIETVNCAALFMSLCLGAALFFLVLTAISLHNQNKPGVPMTICAICTTAIYFFQMLGAIDESKGKKK